jgi:hypothetical protein
MTSMPDRPDERIRDELDKTRFMVRGFIADQHAGRHPDLDALTRSTTPFVLARVLVDEILTLMGPYDPDPDVRTADYRRAAVCAIHAAEGNADGIAEVAGQADDIGRMAHLVTALATTVAQGTTVSPGGLDRLKAVVMQLTLQEHLETNEQE